MITVYQAVRGACLAAGISATVVTASLLIPATEPPILPAQVPAIAQQPVPMTDSLTDRLRSVGRMWPFRPSRSSAQRPLPEGALGQSSLERPPLMLSGLILADPPGAIITGIPGGSGSTVLRPGEAAGGVRLRSVAGTSAVLTGMDTTWTLRLQELE